ncbi:interferon-induced very large GTPase 1-like [Anneissia japonica]|uniref:interferon-induced very large GTPase 1-like n=1 Tax=Anneissia japonica TaxID=1529436 RepID=UPI001425A86F|nr:interferon-induced very large GTPase 1-like [Anneissia japonica]
MAANIPDDNDLLPPVQESTGTSVYPQVIEKLKLQEYYPKGLTREKALAVQEYQISTDDLKDPGKIPWFILQNIMMYNYEGRCFEVSQNLPSTAGMGDSFSFSESCLDETDVCYDTGRISPLDAMVALFLCCDDFLRQSLVEKMSICQLAIPLLLPINTNPNEIEMLLWAMSTLTKQWKRSGASFERSMAVHPLPIISAIRVGRPQLSKSKILNHVISDLKHDIFFHYECDGGNLKRNISNGLLEISWYRPTGKIHETIHEPLTFINLRGNASELESQTRFISEISLATIAFTSSDNQKKEDLILFEKLYEQKGHLILVVDGKPGKCLKESLISLEQKCARIKDKQVGCINSLNKHDVQISKDIRRLLKDICEGNGRCIVPDKSIDMCVEFAENNCFKIDDRTQECFTGKSIAHMMIGGIKPIEKEKQLPLQKIAIKIRKKEKERYLLEHKEDMQIEDYNDKIDSDILCLRNEQKNIFDRNPEVIKLFNRSYAYREVERKYFHSYLKMILGRYGIDQLHPIRQEYNCKWKTFCDIRENPNTEIQELTSRKRELNDLESKISKLSLGLEHFIREMGQIYEMKSDLKLLDDSTRQFAYVAAEMLLNGHPLELMDGDASRVPLTWIGAVLTSLTEIIGSKRLFVLSVLGCQSSGKSTMLNAMFGLQFAVSDGRCTKGVFAQLVTVDTSLQENTGCDYILVVDTEGLNSLELADDRTSYIRDNEMATLVIGLGDATIINIMGQNSAEMQGILEIAAFALIKMKCVNIKPSCLLVHQNVTDVTASNMNITQVRSLQKILDESVKFAAKTQNCSHIYKRFSDIIQFQETKHVMYVSSLWKGDPPLAPPNPGYSECIQNVKRQIMCFLRTSHLKEVKDFEQRLSDLWKAILSENFVFSFTDNIAIQAFSALELVYLEHSRKLRRNAMTYSDNLQTKCNILSANDIENQGKTILQQQTDKFNEDVTTFCTRLEEYFSKHSKACQWKGKTEIKRDELCVTLRKEIIDEFQSIKKNIIGRAEIDSRKKQNEKDILEKAKTLADTFRGKKLSVAELKRKFDDEWKKWIDVIPCFEKNINIEVSLQNIFRSERRMFDRDVTRMLRKTSNRSVYSSIMVAEEDLDFGSWFGRGVKRIWGRNFSKNTCIDKAESIATTLRSSVIERILSHGHDGNNYSEIFGNDLFDFITESLTNVTIDGGVNFRDIGKHRVAMCILWSTLPKLRQLNMKYCQANDMKLYMENTQKVRLWEMFKDECMAVEISIKAASMVSRELESAIQISLPSKCKHGVLEKTKSGAFANKMAFHAQLLIELANKNCFDSYRAYLPNPYQCMDTYIGECIHNVCEGTTKNGKTVLEEIYYDKLNSLYANAEQAINDTCKHYQGKCKITVWWPKLVEKISQDLDVKQELRFFNEDGCFDVDDFKERLLSKLQESKNNIMKLFKGVYILDAILEPCRKFLKNDLLGCHELCIFCKTPCDLQLGNNDEHRTRYHRPQGVSGYHNLATKKLVTNVCTTNVMSTNATFVCEETNRIPHLYCDYQSVNEYYKTWKIQPVARQSQLYWKWFMATYNNDLAGYYGCQPADIPDGWKQITLDLAIAELKKTYNL